MTHGLRTLLVLAIGAAATPLNAQAEATDSSQDLESYQPLRLTEVDVRRLGRNLPALDRLEYLGEKPAMENRFLLIHLWDRAQEDRNPTFETMNRFAEVVPEDSFALIGVSHDSPESIAAFLRQHPLEYPVASDPDFSLFSGLQITRANRVIITDPFREIVWEGKPAALNREVIERVSRTYLGKVACVEMLGVASRELEERIAESTGSLFPAFALVADAEGEFQMMGPFMVGPDEVDRTVGRFSATARKLHEDGNIQAVVFTYPVRFRGGQAWRVAQDAWAPGLFRRSFEREIHLRDGETVVDATMRARLSPLLTRVTGENG